MKKGLPIAKYISREFVFAVIIWLHHIFKLELELKYEY